MKKFIKNTVNSIRANAIRLAATYRSGEGYIDTAVKILIAVVLGALLLAGLYAVLPLLMTYMGHRSVQATSQYIHLSAESFPAILKQSESLFGNLIPLEDNSNETSI